MPYILTKVTTPLSREDEKTLTQAYGKLIEIFPGKTERFLMVDFEDNCRMHLAGTDEDCAMVTIAIFGKGPDASFDAMTQRVSELLEKVCKIPQDKIYVKYEEVDHWGWTGSNF